ncbi:c-type cytochrome biogenesis protein CcmI [Billgrantia endophytica]|uniref:C-type cytochrome biogenesis protein CcmI n=1 Tax=Billgrantia endophytica TaxID=2033802 RepID=A0A2N7U2H3_9GAMM|nr:c-type cytochrome biogenesis protein CcmI [Halomonas endophytica]PMR74613.1 c-type cytochrome biogenesis protein CcmI [Halomonas endophytica]
MNGMFLMLALTLCVAALAFVVYPLLREPRQQRVHFRRAINLAVHRDRVRELDQDLATGTLTQSQYDSALADLERELLDSGAIEPDEAVASPTRPERGRGPQRVAGMAVFVSVAVLPFMAMGIYLSVGHAEDVFATRLPPGESQTAATAPPASEASMRRQFEMLSRQLQGRLAQNPGELEDWVLLGRTLVFLDDLAAAERAFREAMAHGGERAPDLLTRYADVLAERQGSMGGEPAILIERALAIDPDHAQGLWMAGSLAFEEADLGAARRHWERLLGVLPADSPEAGVIRGNLSQVEQAAAEG